MRNTYININMQEERKAGSDKISDTTKRYIGLKKIFFSTYRTTSNGTLNQIWMNICTTVVIVWIRSLYHYKKNTLLLKNINLSIGIFLRMIYDMKPKL